MKVLVTGTSGMVGRGVLLECLDHQYIDEVISIGRTSTKLIEPGFVEIIHDDFSDFTTLKDKLQGLDAAYLCMGVSASGLTEKKYTTITYDYTLALAKVLIEINPNMTITYVSGGGTDSTEKSRTMWARVKGKTENDLLNLGFKQAFMFRPNAIIPLRNIKSKTKLYQFVYDYFTWLVKLMKVISPNSVVDTTQIGIAMINATLKGYEKRIIDPKDILILAK